MISFIILLEIMEKVKMTAEILQNAMDHMKAPYPYTEPWDPRGKPLSKWKLSGRRLKTQLFYRYIRIPFTERLIRLWKRKPDGFIVTAKEVL